MAGVILFETIGEAESDGADFDQRVRHRRSRRKGWRAGLASHTVIENLEDPQCYRSFERTIARKRSGCSTQSGGLHPPLRGGPIESWRRTTCGIGVHELLMLVDDAAFLAGGLE